jgi:hypothetical protein
LTGDLSCLGLGVVSLIQNDQYRAEALAALVPNLEEDLLKHGLSVALQLFYDDARTKAVDALVSRADAELLQNGLDAAIAIGDMCLRAQALITLASYLSGECRNTALNHALNATMAIYYPEDTKGRVLAALAPLLTNVAWQHGLEIAMRLKNKSALAAYLSVENSSPQVYGKLVQQAMVNVLSQLRFEKREELLEFVATKELFDNRFVPTVVTGKIPEQIIRICRDWVWL